MISNIRFPFVVVRTDYLEEQTRETKARLESTIKSLNEKIKAIENMKKSFEKDKDSVERDIKYWRQQFSVFSEQPCLECGKTIIAQPFGDRPYYLERGGIVHPGCVDEYRKRPDWQPRTPEEKSKN